MLKKYIDRDSSVISSVNLDNSVPHEQNQMDTEDSNFVKSDPSSSKLQNSDILKDLDQKLSHLDSDKNFTFGHKQNSGCNKTHSTRSSISRKRG